MTEENLKKLLSEMTIKEKIGQMVQLAGDCFGGDAMAVGPQKKLGITQETVDTCGSVLNVMGAKEVCRIQRQYLKRSRLKIPLLFMSDIIYGYRTVYPIPLGMGATWNPELICDAYRIIGEEAVSDGAMVTFSPPADLIRDARWGRCLEMPGEDHYLISCFAKAMTEGFQKDGKMAACVKHFAGYGAVEAGREYNTVDMSERCFREHYLPGYKAAIDAGCEMVMTSFNLVDGIPATANQWLLKDILREEWNFDGVVITDYAAIQELKNHGVASDDYEAAELAMNATVDIDMKTSCYANQLEKLLEDGKISRGQIDDACWRILKLKNKLGLFENPYHRCGKESVSLNEKAQSAREVSRRSIVMLKNDGVLPLADKEQKLALIGPYGDSQDIIGMWAVHADRKYAVTIKKAMEERLGKDGFSYALGCEMLEDYSGLGEFGHITNIKGKKLSKEELYRQEKEAIQVAENADIVVMALGEHMLQSGEGGSRTELSLPAIQKRLLKKIRQTGKKVVLVLFSGRPLVLSDIIEDCDALLEVWFPGTEGGHSICDILFGDFNPSGRLTVSFPYCVGQEPLYYAQFNTGRPKNGSDGRFVSSYQDAPNEAMFPFGFGLSYHTAVYSNLRLDHKTMNAGQELHASVDVKNTGSIEGTETIQMYIRDLTGSVARPILELKGFQQVDFKPGESKVVTFTITEEMLRFYRRDMTFGSEPGKFEVFVGANSRDLLKDQFVLEVENES